MSVYICVIDPATDRDANGLAMTSTEFAEFRTFVAEQIEGDFSVLMGFDTWDGEWTLEEARALSIEATLIEMRLRQTKIPRRLVAKAMKRARVRGQAVPRSMNEYFITHDGEPIASTLRVLATLCIALEGTIRSQ